MSETLLTPTTDILPTLASEFQEFLKEFREFRQIVEVRFLHVAPLRRDPSSSTIQEAIGVVARFYNGNCPCCAETHLLQNDDCRLLTIAEIDHWTDNRSRNKPQDVWPICSHCHKRFTAGRWTRDSKRALFDAYQQHRQNAHWPLFGHHLT